MDYTKKLLEVRDLHKAYSKEGVPTKAQAITSACIVRPAVPFLTLKNFNPGI